MERDGCVSSRRLSSLVEPSKDWTPITPHFSRDPTSTRLFRNRALTITRLLRRPKNVKIDEALASYRRLWLNTTPQQSHSDKEAKCGLATSFILDLAENGWGLKVHKGKVLVRRPQKGTASVALIKDRIRKGHLLQQRLRLQEPSVQTFIREMETRRLGPKGWASIFNLMRDGKELAVDLARISILKHHDAQITRLRDLIQPYIQPVSQGLSCRFTGIRLFDIWRYFRFTWSTLYNSTPGRRMKFLVRDAAAPFHPIIGIAELSSSVVQLTCRDQWIGWHPKQFLHSLAENPSPKSARWILSAIRESINGIHIADFLRQRLLRPSDIAAPSPRILKRLMALSESEMKRHHRFPKNDDIKALQSGKAAKKAVWRSLAKTPLYRAKRAKTLAQLLQARMALRSSGFSRPTVAGLKRALAWGPGRKALSAILRRVKAENVGVSMMDITTCGAIAPYNILLGGKLVSVLLATPEVVNTYQKRYLAAPSLIASCMKGAPVIRQPKLVLLVTTSLYMSGSSQYNRIAVPAEALGGKQGHRIEYKYIGQTLGFGNYHLSRETVTWVEKCLARSKYGRRVNSIFGEGVSPLMRKLRDGFLKVGLPDALLQHGSPRLVYGIALADNFRDVLLDRSLRPRYIVPTSQFKKSTEAVAAYWRERWLRGRIGREGILDRVAQHSLEYPISHDARVFHADDEDQYLSFRD